jgi:hypothetical protein
VETRAAEIEDGRRRRPALRPVARVAVLSAALVAALSAVGGLGYAMSVATNLVVKAKSHATYAKQDQLAVKMNAAVAQYGTTTNQNDQGGNNNDQGGNNNNQGGGGGGVGNKPNLVSAAPGDGSTVQSVSSILLVSDLYVDWTNLHVTRPDGSVTTLDNRQGTSQQWIFEASAPGLYSISGSFNGNNGSGTVDFSSHFTIFVPSTGGGSTQAPPPVQATVKPTQSGTITSSDGKATIVWAAEAFSTTPVVVQVSPVPESAVQNLPPNSLVMQVTASAVGTNANVTALNGVIEVQFPAAAPGLVPLVSSDGATWRAVPQLSGLVLPAGQPDGFFRDSGGTVHMLTRHLTFFALATPSASTKLVLKIVSSPTIWTVDRKYVSLYLNLTAPAKVSSQWFDSTGALVPSTTQRTRVLRAGVTILRLRIPALAPGNYRLQVNASGIGQTATATKRIHVAAVQPRTPAPSSARPAGVVVIDGTRRLVAQLTAKLGARFAVTSSAGAALFDAIDPRSTRTVAIVVDLDTTPVSTIAAIHSVFPELEITAVASDPISAKAGRRAGATVVIAKPTSIDALSSAVRQLITAGP